MRRRLLCLLYLLGQLAMMRLVVLQQAKDLLHQFTCLQRVGFLFHMTTQCLEKGLQ